MQREEFFELKHLVHLDALKKREREFKLSSCEGKYPFPDRDTATRSLRRKDLCVYRCQVCFLWHVGHVNPKDKRNEARHR